MSGTPPAVYNGSDMSFSDAIRRLNELKRRRLIRDYVVIGAVAAAAYVEPVLTEDIDVVVLVDTDDEFWEAYRRVGDTAEGLEGMHHVLGGRPVQMFPSTIKPIYRDALAKARQSRIGNVRVKIASPEHLVMLALEASRYKDKLRIAELLALPDTDREAIWKLIEEFDDEERVLAERFCSVG